MGSSTQDHGAPAQVVYHASPIMADWRAEVALMRLRVASTMARVITEDDPDAGITTREDLLGAPRPSVGVGRTFGPTHTRRGAARARIAANGTGLPITHERITRRPPASPSVLDVAPRCPMTDLLAPTCAHCLGHDTSDE